MSGVELALSASGARLLCGVRRVDGGEVLVPDDVTTEGRGTDLAIVVDALFRAHGLEPASLTALRVDVGPGSYTGLRVATTFARTIAAFHGAALSRFTSLELAACAAWSRGDAPLDRDIVVVLDARRRRLHVGRLALADGRVQVVPPAPAAVDASELRQWLAPAATVLAAEALHETLRPVCDASGSLLHTPTAANATDLFAPGLVPVPVSPEAIEPLYLMATYADD